MSYTLFSPAKINLCLHVTGYDPKTSFHHLESVVAFARWGDFLYITPSDHFSMTLTGTIKNVPIDNHNILYKTIDILQKHHIHVPPLQITIEKHIPTGAGLGGGSSNAATFLLWVQKYLYPTLSDKALNHIALEIGADVPICLYRKTALMKGFGEKITPLDAPTPPLLCLLVKPRHALCTKEIFTALNNKHNPSIPTDTDIIGYAFTSGRNDLTAPAFKQAPILKEIITSLGASEALKSDMTGSGSACFALYNTVQQMNKAITALHIVDPNLWIQSTIIF